MLCRHMDGQGFIILGTALYRIQYTKYKYCLLWGELSICATDLCTTAISLALLCRSQRVPSKEYLPCLLLCGIYKLITKWERVSPCSLHNAGMDHCYCITNFSFGAPNFSFGAPKPNHSYHSLLCSVVLCEERHRITCILSFEVSHENEYDYFLQISNSPEYCIQLTARQVIRGKVTYSQSLQFVAP